VKKFILRSTVVCSRPRENGTDGVGTARGIDTGGANPKGVRWVGRRMRTESEIRARIEELEAEYDAYDPPTSELEDTAEIATLRAIEELEWVLGEYDESAGFTT